MPASSRAQQSFFGLVRAVQKGEVPAARVTSNVRQAAKDASPSDVEDMMTAKSKNIPDKVDMPNEKEKKDENVGGGGMNFFDIVGKYNEYGRMLKRENTLSELGQQLSDIAEYAEYTLTNEMDDWFDTHTVQRNVKEMKSYAKEFQKIAQEADSHNMRMAALYDDMGRVLERYFDIYDNQEAQPATEPSPTVQANPAQPIQQETGMDSGGDMTDDAMNERVVSMARSKLRGESLIKFDLLPKPTQVGAAWRMLK